MRSLVADALGDLLAFDSRVLRTLRPLFLRPGFLTAEWCRGRRVPYVPPFRLYVLVAALFFFVLAVTETPLVVIETTAEDERPPAAEGMEGAGTGEAPIGERIGEGPGEEPRETQEEPEEEPAEGPEELDLEAFQESFIDHLGRVSLLQPPVLALLLAGVYWSRRRFLVEHLVFSLHVHSAAYLALSASAFLPAGVWGRGLAAAVPILLVVYVSVALTQVYGGRWWGTALRMVVLVFGYALLATVPAVFLAFQWTRMTLGASGSP